MLELISEYLGAFITTLSTVVFGKYVLKQKIAINKYYALLLSLIVSLILCFLLKYNLLVLKTIVCFLLYMFLFKAIFLISGIKNLILSVIFYFLLFSGEILFFIFTSLLFKITGNEVYITFGGTIIGNFVVSIFCILLSLLMRREILKTFTINIKNKMIIYWIFLLLCVIMYFIVIFSSPSLNIETYLVLLMVTIILIVIFISIGQTYRNNELTIKYDKLLDFIKKYEKEIDRQRVIRHEVKNQLLMIKAKIIDDDEKNSIISYINEIICDNNDIINHSEYAKLRYLPSNGIKGLFYFKVDEAISFGLNVSINISKNMERSFLRNVNLMTFNHLGKVLGIFLDNAIDGAKRVKNGLIGIEIYNEDDLIYFIISNVYDCKIRYRLDGSLKSSKGLDRGHGLTLANSIIHANIKFKNEMIISDNMFVQKLIIKK